jgi:hypothetical protein
MSDLTKALDRIMNWLEANYPTAASGFRKSLSVQDIQERLDKLPFRVSREVYEFYQWRNGDESYSSVFGYLWMLDLDRACEFSDFVNDVDLLEIREKEGEPKYLLPLFDFDGEYFAVRGGEALVDSATIFHVGTAYDLKPAFVNLTSMMTALAECFESGVYEVQENHLEVVDVARFGEIRRKHNPGTVQSIYSEGW